MIGKQQLRPFSPCVSGKKPTKQKPTTLLSDLFFIYFLNIIFLSIKKKSDYNIKGYNGVPLSNVFNSGEETKDNHSDN